MVRRIRTHLTTFFLLLANLVASIVPRNEEVRESLGVEVSGPMAHVALGGSPLTLSYKLDDVNNRTDFSPSKLLSLSIQLTFLEEEDGTESFVGTKDVLPTLQWNQVTFECGLIVRGGVYHIRLIDSGAESSSSEDTFYYVYIESYNGLPLESHNTIRLRVEYPTIDFDVPHRLEAYTTDVLIAFGLTKSLCPPQRPLPPTELFLVRSPSDEEGFKELQFAAPLMDNPLLRLEREGQVSVPVECQLWARNSTYRVEMREKLRQRKLIAKSGTIKVDWSWKFGLSVSKSSIVPCRKTIRVALSYPDCVLHGKDKVRVYGYESLPVPSLLAPRRQSYITERQIQTNGTDGRSLFFPCTLFPQRFSKYCFQYVNIGEDESVAIVMESCIPTFPPDKFTDGGWGSWSMWSECSVSCGNDGKKFRYRFCDTPQPSFGGNFCEGESIEEKVCGDGEKSLPTCSPSLPSPSTLKSPTLAPNESPEVEFPRNYSNDELDGPWGVGSKDERHYAEERKKGIPTTGCECGCILQDLIPGFNYTLVISLTSNHSICEDEDEEEHHNLRWILHSRGPRDRIRFQILAAAARCIVLTFRDGNTSDSNLLQLINAPLLTRPNQIATIESTGTSLSIGASDEIQENCSFPSMYFLGFYEVLPPLPPRQDPFLSWKEFWTFLFLKLSLLLFLFITCVSIVSVCAKKVYDYKELKSSRTEDEEGGSSGGMDYLTTSRTTSVTLMSFDHTYLRRLRLKHFLLRPRKLNHITMRVKSLPNTPNSRRRRTRLLSEKETRETGDETRLLSISDSNLERHLRNTLHAEANKREERHEKIPLTTEPRVSTPSTSTDITPRVISKEKRSGGESTSYIESAGTSLNDLEMDYYDYDIQNAGNIPGSYLLEPSFVFWTDTFDQSTSDQIDQGIELLNTSTSMGGTISSSMGLFTPEPPSAMDLCVMETSFDTLHGSHFKFADDEEDDEEAETRTISDYVAETQSFIPESSGKLCQSLKTKTTYTN